MTIISIRGLSEELLSILLVETMLSNFGKEVCMSHGCFFVFFWKNIKRLRLSERCICNIILFSCKNIKIETKRYQTIISNNNLIWHTSIMLEQELCTFGRSNYVTVDHTYMYVILYIRNLRPVSHTPSDVRPTHWSFTVFIDIYNFRPINE